MRPTIAGWNSERYSARTAGVSRAGSQVMKMGRRGGRAPEVGEEGVGEAEEEVWGEERRGEALTRSIIWAILSSSSGQMSGQWEKPK